MTHAELRAVPALDMHSHFNHGHPHDSTTDERYACDLEFILQANRLANVQITVCSTFASVLHGPSAAEENDLLFDLCLQIPSLYQWVVIDPREPHTFEQAEEMLGKRKCLGIKLHPPLHGYSTAEYGDLLFGFAEEHRAFVQIHPEAEPDIYLPFADRYPHMILDVAHLGGAGFLRAIREAKHRNIYSDTSGSASRFNHIIEAACECGCSDRILYGSDTYDVGFQRGRIEYAVISEEDKLRILRNNALGIFPQLNL